MVWFIPVRSQSRYDDHLIGFSHLFLGKKEGFKRIGVSGKRGFPPKLRHYSTGTMMLTQWMEWGVLFSNKPKFEPIASPTKVFSLAMLSPY